LYTPRAYFLNIDRVIFPDSLIIDSFANPQKDLPALKSLDLYRNDITQMEDYRSKVFGLLPGLTYLDGTDVENKEADESDGDGDALEDEELEPAPVNGKASGAGDAEIEDEFKAGNGAESSPESFALSPEEHQLGPGATEEVYDSSSVAEGEGEGEGEVEEEEEDDEDEDLEDSDEEDGIALQDLYREELEVVQF